MTVVVPTFRRRDAPADSPKPRVICAGEAKAVRWAFMLAFVARQANDADDFVRTVIRIAVFVCYYQCLW